MITRWSWTVRSTVVRITAPYLASQQPGTPGCPWCRRRATRVNGRTARGAVPSGAPDRSFARRFGRYPTSRAAYGIPSFNAASIGRQPLSARDTVAGDTASLRPRRGASEHSDLKQRFPVARRSMPGEPDTPSDVGSIERGCLGYRPWASAYQHRARSVGVPGRWKGERTGVG